MCVVGSYHRLRNRIYLVGRVCSNKMKETKEQHRSENKSKQIGRWLYFFGLHFSIVHFTRARNFIHLLIEWLTFIELQPHFSFEANKFIDYFLLFIYAYGVTVHQIHISMRKKRCRTSVISFVCVFNYFEEFESLLTTCLCEKKNRKWNQISSEKKKRSRRPTKTAVLRHMEFLLLAAQ